jgi:hypothetical protein
VRVLRKILQDSRYLKWLISSIGSNKFVDDVNGSEELFRCRSGEDDGKGLIERMLPRSLYDVKIKYVEESPVQKC